MKHIPGSETSELQILSFADAVQQSQETNYDKQKWIYVPDFYTEYRYVLGTRGKRPVICAGINPSTAAPDRLDPTLQSVSRVASSNGFDSWLMFNVYAQRATMPDDMDQLRNERLHEENMKAFRVLLELAGMRPVVWAAWGTIIEKRPWLINCVRDMFRIAEEYDTQWVCAGRRSKKGHPHHPLYLQRNEPFCSFDMEAYLL